MKKTKLFSVLASAVIAVSICGISSFAEEYEAREVNRHAVEVSDECYIASNGTVEIDFPYHKGCVRHLPDETFEDFDGVYNLWGYTYTDERKESLRRLFESNGGRL